ncbi:hypothetical protein Hanom_Chr08g00709681 [Helianthus anomalus]
MLTIVTWIAVRSGSWNENGYVVREILKFGTRGRFIRNTNSVRGTVYHIVWYVVSYIKQLLQYSL